MRKMKYSGLQRLIAMLLALVLTVGLLPRITVPAAADASGAMLNVNQKLADPSTMDDWVNYFGPDRLSTEFAGGVWTDKTVLASDDQFQHVSLSDPNNFMVALTAIASNKEVAGHTSASSDTMLVLDVSQSMDQISAVPTMVEAANASIEKLQGMNKNNRIGVVLFSGSTQEGNSTAGTALTILPLDRYKANGDGKYLDYDLTEGGWNSDDDTTIKRASGMTKEDGTPVSGTSSKQTVGGTYTQNGLYKAWQEFEDVTDTAVSSGAGETKRTPIVILMTDGDPTTGTSSYNSVGTSNIGDGYAPSTYNGYRLSFAAQLTAAWIKGKLEEKYSSDAKFYTLGLGISSSESATAVLYPASSRETVTGWWDTYLAAADGSEVELSYTTGGLFGSTYTWEVRRDSAVKAMNYVDRFWSANEADELPSIFDEITAEIEVSSKYSVTLVESGDYDMDGYITFADPLGALMEVKSIKGISAGDTVFTGRELAKSMNSGALGSVENPTDYGDELIRTIKERIGITNTSVAQQLVGAAYAAGQIGYTDDNNYSNFLGWYGDGSNNYMGFWQQSDGISPDSAPAGAVYANRSYLYLGAEGNSDMMHVIVQVNTEIATGKQSVTFKIPAGLIPTVTYRVEAQGDSLEDASKLTRVDAQPMRLLYEVGLQSDINAINLDAKLAEYLAADPENHIHTNPDGTYTFYTNSWGMGDGDHAPEYNEEFAKVMPDSHFNPSYQNERYYHVETDPIYVKNGSAYELYSRAAAPSGSGYYYRRTVITAATNGGAASVSYIYAPIAESILANPDNLEQTGSTWNVKAGVVHADTERFETLKTTNTTNTLSYSNYPLVSHTGGYNVYAFLGNNGLLTVEPAQGIKLSKTVSQASTEEGAPTSFTFKVTLDADLAAGSFSVTDADGAALPAAVTREGGKTVVTLTLSDRQTAYITGLPTGTGYTVHEEQTVYYNSNYEHDSVSGTVAKYTVSEVDFVNDPRQESTLAITKKVLHPFEGRPAALNNISFTVEVDLGQQAAGMTFPLAEGGSVTADENGVLTVSVKADATVTIQGILEDTPYEIREVNVPSGFVWNQASSTGLVGEIAPTGSTALLINDYVSSPPVVNPQVEISVNKHIEGDYLEDESFTFNVELLNKTTGQYELLATKTVTIPWPSHDSGTVSIGDIVGGFTQLGSNTFRITEADGSTVGMTYSSQIASFRVDVVDPDMDGKLEVEVVGLANTAVTKDDSGYNVGANFTNIYDVDSTYVDVNIKKNLTNNTGIDIPLTGFQFSLYADPACTQLAHITEGEHLTVHAGPKGDVALRIPVTNISQDGAVYYLKEVVPASTEPGMSYSDAIYKVTLQVQAVENGGDPMLSATADVELYSGTGSVESGTVVFNNTYELQAATATIQGTKTYLRGYDNQSAPMKAGDFSFQLWTTNAQREAEKLVETVEVNADGTFSFSTLSFTGVGTYQYLVREVPGDKSYITYDTVDHFAMVVVTKGEGGKLEAELRYRKDGAAENTPQAQFTNIYNVSGTASTTIGGSKTLEVLSGVKSLVGNDFTFGLYLDGQQVATAKNIANGSFTFPAQIYQASEVGNTYSYTVKEIVPEGAVQNPDGSYTYNGVTYSTASFQVEVKLVDNGDGTVSAQQTLLEAEKIAFTNSYSAKPASYTISGQKNLTGRALSEGEFTFELFETDETYTVTGSPKETVTNAPGGSFRFTALGYSAVGTHYYVVREYIPAQSSEERLGGVSYDAGLYQIKVQVTDNGTGQLTAMVTVYRPGSANTNILFGNKYEAAPAIVDLEATKIYDRLEAEQFSFELEGDINGTPVEQTKTNDADGLVVFDTLIFDKAGTYEFKVTETDDTSIFPWIFFDKTVYTVKIEVKDNLEGNLVPTVSYTTDKGDADSIVFTNSYILEDEVKVTLEGTKTYENTVTKQPMEMKDGMFQFQLSSEDYGKDYSKTVTNVGGSFTFPELVFTEEDVGQTYTFTVKELDGGKDYIGYDDAVYTVEIAIGDDLAGGLTVTKTVNGSPDTPIAFANTYTPAPAIVELEAQKEYTKPMTGGDFSFVLEGDIDGTPVAQTKTNDAQGLVDFDTLTFENEGTYTFTVTETDGGKDYIGYDETVYTVTVKVEDNKAGNLVPTVTYATAEGSESSITFTNTYIFVRTASVELSGTKTYENTLTGFYKAIGEDMFQVQLTGPGVNETVKVKPDGSFKFTDLVYDGDDAGETYTYTVKELPGDKTYIGYDTAEYTVTVEIKDDGLGGVTATKTVKKNGADAADIRFANTYTPAPVKVRLEAQKEYTKSLAENKFTFLLDGYIGTTPISQDKQNDAQGKVLFDELTFEREGTYTFTVKEQKGDKQYIEYDGTAYTVTVKVTDPGDGQLKADVSYKAGTAPADSIRFVNTYKFISGASVELEGTKSYTNTVTNQPMAISDGMFSFKVSSADYRGGYSETVTNVGGSFAFADLAFNGTDAGKTYTFTVEELDGGKDYIGYDEAKYTVVIAIADNGVGGLTVTKTVNGETDNAIAFANTYNPAPATVELEAQKSYDKPMAGGEFSFVLSGDIDGTPVEQTKTNDAGGKVLFDKLTFENIGQYTFTVTETPDTENYPWIDFDGTSYTVNVDVKDNDGLGNLVADVTYATAEGSESSISFTNAYKFITGDSVSIEGVKNFVESTMEGGEFTFNLYQTGEDYAIEGATLIGTATNDAEGNFSFLPEDVEQFNYSIPGTHHYALLEDATEPMDQVLYDENIYNFKVEVTDIGQGAVDAQIICVNATSDTVQFRNVPFGEITEKTVAMAADPTVSVDGKYVKPGEDIVYTLRYTNYLGKEAEVTFTDVIPENTAYVDGSAGDGVYDGKTGTLTWTVTAQPEEVITVSFKVTANAPDKVVKNKATITDGKNTYTTNEVTSHTFEEVVEKAVSLESAPAVSIDGKKAEIGSILVYTIRYNNLTGEKASVTVTDKLPAHTTFVSASTGGVHAEGTVKWTVDVEAWQSVIVTVKVKVDTPEVTLKNKATVLEGENEYTSNEVTTETYEKVTPPTGDSFQMVLLCVLLLASGMGIVILAATGKKKKTEQ